VNPAALQIAIFNRLESWQPLDDLLASRVTPDGVEIDAPAIYDHVPQNVDEKAKFPFVVIGDDTAVDFDTDDSVGSEATITIHAWSRQRGRLEAKNIQREIYNALNRHELDVDGRHTVDCIYEYAESILEQDGITRHGVIRFRITTEEV